MLEKKKRPIDYIGTLEGYKQFMSRVDDLIGQLDFGRIRKTMEVLNWTWFSLESDKERIPSESELLIQARKLLVDCVEKGYGGTGGFEVLSYVYDEPVEGEPDDFEHRVHLSICFAVESARDNW